MRPPGRGRRLQACLVLLLLGSALAACAPGPQPPVARDTPAPSAASAPTSPSPAEAASPSPPVGLQVGQRAPEFTLTTLDGQPLTSADLLAQQKPFVLFFFATW